LGRPSRLAWRAVVVPQSSWLGLVPPSRLGRGISGLAPLLWRLWRRTCVAWPRLVVRESSRLGARTSPWLGAMAWL